MTCAFAVEAAVASPPVPSAIARMMLACEISRAAQFPTRSRRASRRRENCLRDQLFQLRRDHQHAQTRRGEFAHERLNRALRAMSMPRVGSSRSELRVLAEPAREQTFCDCRPTARGFSDIALAALMPSRFITCPRSPAGARATRRRAWRARATRRALNSRARTTRDDPCAGFNRPQSSG